MSQVVSDVSEKIIQNYGYVPFKGFQHVVWVILLTFLALHEMIRNKTNIHVQRGINIIAFAFIVTIIYFDVKYSSFSLKNMGVSKKMNKYINYTLRVLGCYGIIQVLAQDFGVKTGENQAKFVRQPIIQWVIYVATAYTVTENRSEAMIGSTLYFILKYLISENKTSDVCFEDV